MFDVKTMIEEIATKREIKNISFVGCGGSLACFYAPYYYVTHEAKTLTTLYENANEFTNDTPKFINENSIVVCASRRGNTPQTVEAAKKAKECGAMVIGLQLETGTPLDEICDYVVQFKDTGVDGALYEESKSSLALQIAYETVNVVEHNVETYEKMVSATKKMNELIPAAVKKCVPDAVKFSLDYAKDDIIYTIGSGTGHAGAHQQSICIFMEMQWINSSAIHSDEFFNGPFEITEKDTAFLMLKSTGVTRAVDERALRFLDKYNNHTTVLDGYDYGMKELGDVSGYFDHDFYSELLDVYNNLLADRRQHPLSWRKYMWKFGY